MVLTGQQREDRLSVALDLLVEERLTVEVDTLIVVRRAHVDEVPAGQLVGVHPQALQVVCNSIDGYRENINDQYHIHVFNIITG